jgi:hypothetical protein
LYSQFQGTWAFCTLGSGTTSQKTTPAFSGCAVAVTPTDYATYGTGTGRLTIGAGQVTGWNDGTSVKVTPLPVRRARDAQVLPEQGDPAPTR